MFAAYKERESAQHFSDAHSYVDREVTIYTFRRIYTHIYFLAVGEHVGGLILTLTVMFGHLLV